MRGSRDGEASGIYVHVPFCSAICPYCDFAVARDHPARRARYVDALVREIRSSPPTGLHFDTVYFGGGTPSTLAGDDLAMILEALRRQVKLDEDAWISLEANPEHVDSRRLSQWLALGVRTLSIGVQSFGDDALRFLGRRHRRVEAVAAIRRALAADFYSVSADLMFGLPGQNSSALRADLDQLVTLGPQHISLYQLTVHEKTPFHRQRSRGMWAEANEEVQGELYALVHETLGAGGYEAYEVSNFARHQDYRSRHNQKYWRHIPYLGFGVGAHSFLGRRRWWNERSLIAYCKRIEAGLRPEVGSEELSDGDLCLESVMLSLRCRDGIHLGEFQRTHGLDLAHRNRPLMEQWVADGLAIWGEAFRLTPRGMAVADALVRALELEPE